MSDHPTILITGGTRRLGKAIGEHYARLGWRLVLCYARDRDAAEETRSSLAAEATSVRIIQCDTGEPEQVESMLEGVAGQEGRLDFLLHNVGLYLPKPATEITPQDWQRTISTNLNGGFYCAHHGLDLLRASGGLLGFMGYSGVEMARADPDAMDYQVSKVALLSLVRTLGVAYGPLGVRVAMVSPGQMLNSIDLPQSVKHIPVPRWGTEEDLCQAWDYLLAASYVTGVNVDVAGGFRL
jgi:NAD(P)-dependent dehydrogenase (short-subunit alcohol dehydrogenase family)